MVRVSKSLTHSEVAAVAATIPAKKTVYAKQPTTTPATTPAVVTRDVSGKFTSKTTGTDGVAQQKQENQNDKLSSILKDAVGSKKETIKDTAGRMAMGPFYDIGKEILDATGSMRDNAKDEQSTMGRLKNWGKAKMGIKPSKAEALHDKAQAKHDKVEAASDKAEAKHDQLQAKADRGESSEGHYRHSPHDLPLDKSQSHPERRARSSSGQHSQKGNNLLLPGKGHH